MKKSDYKSLLIKIIYFNHAWKLAKKSYGYESSITTSLRDQKACLQAQLLREFNLAYLVLDEDVETDEPLYSVRLNDGLLLEGLGFRTDAEHLPVRMAEKLLSRKEIVKLQRD